MKMRLLLTLVGLAISFTFPTFAQEKEPTPSESTPEATPTPTSVTQVLPDRRITFRLSAPYANAVQVLIGVKSRILEVQGATTTDMTKDLGLWTVTLGPFEPNLYEYFFKVDGLQIADPGNTTPKPEWKIDTSLLLVPGDPLLDTQNVAHGTVREETYYSTSLGKQRRLLVYTPPNYDRFPCSPLPVLYLYHGWRGTRYSWVTEGRLPQILDNLLAQGKAVSMIVVVPEANALDLETIGDGRENPGAYDFTTNRAAVDEELFHDVIPFAQAHYRISDDSRERAIAGLSMGGLQAIDTGLAHLGYFSWIGAFSPGPLAAFSNEVQDALKDPNKINKNLRLFLIVTGDKDFITGLAAESFDKQLRELNIQHAYTVMPGTHSMFVFRPALSNFLQEIFKH